MKLELNPDHFVELIKKSYSLDHIYLLNLLNKNYDLSLIINESVKIKALVSTLIRKGLITETNELTVNGKELLIFLNTKTSKKFIKKKVESSEFDKWWSAYPGTDTFTYKGKIFNGSRTIRCAKEDCRLKFDKILLEGEYTTEQLIEALKYDVLQKKESSVIEKKNKLSFIQNSLTYLNQRSFEPFIELINSGVTVKQAYVPRGSTDI